MQMREKDEKKRSILWRVVMTASTLVILFVFGFFTLDAVNGNPIEGEWIAEEKGYYLEFDDDYEMTVTGVFDGVEEEYELNYKLDKSQKLITIKMDNDNEHVSKAWETEDTSDAAHTQSVTFAYSLGRKTLTLTDRDYGSEFVFTRK